MIKNFTVIKPDTTFYIDFNNIKKLDRVFIVNK